MEKDLEPLINAIIFDGINGDELNIKFDQIFNILKLKIKVNDQELFVKDTLDLQSEFKLNNIIYNNEYKPEVYGEEIPIQVTDTQPYFVIEKSDDIKIRFFINFIDKKNTAMNKVVCPEGYFVFDYFASGELYLNIPEDKYIVSAKHTFDTLYYKHLNGGALSNHPTEVDYKPTQFATSCLSPTNDFPILGDQVTYAWRFELSKFFHIVDASEIDVKNKKSVNNPPVCKYLTLHTNVHNITSEYYNFANIVLNRSVCSSPTIGSTSYITSCPFVDMGPFGGPIGTCISYVPLFKVLNNVSIRPQNTEQEVNIRMRYSNTLLKEHSFIIENISANTTLSTLQYPSEISYEDAVAEANGVFDEFISCYTDHELNQKEHSNDTETPLNKTSYIQTLLGV